MILKVKDENGQFKEVVLKGLKGDKGDKGDPSHQEDIDNIKSALDNSYLYNIVLKSNEVINNNWSDVIQNCLDIYKTIYIPDGDYNLDKEIILSSGNKIVMSKNARLNRTSSKGKMFLTKYNNNTTAYDGENGITLIGGILNAGSIDRSASVITLFHAKDITIDNVTFLDTVGSHTIDIIGCDNVKIRNCIIRGYKTDDDGLYREAIQIDTAYSNGTGFNTTTTPENSKCYDGTRCKNIFIEDNVFEASNKYPAPLNAIGTHTQYASDSKHKNIFISNNVITGDGEKNNYGNAIRLLQMKDVIISGNKIDNVFRGIVIDNSNKEYDNSSLETDSIYGYNENIKITNNIIFTQENSNDNTRCLEVNCNNTLLGSGKVTNHKNIDISCNLLINNSPTTTIRIETADHINIDNNQIIGGSYGIIIYPTNCTNVITNNNKYINNSGVYYYDGKSNGCMDYIDILNNDLLLNNSITSTNNIEIGKSDNSGYRAFVVRRNGNDGKTYKARFGAGVSSKFDEGLTSLELYDDTIKTTISRTYLSSKAFFPSVQDDISLDLGVPGYRWNRLYCNSIDLAGTYTVNRPTDDLKMGTMIYDSNLKKPIWWDGTTWKDASGTIV